MNYDINEQLSKLLSEFNLVAYKLQTLSASFDKLIEKVDGLTEKISETKERQLIDRQSIQILEEKQEAIDNKIKEIDNNLTKVRISMAEKLAWGSAGGSIAAGLIKIIELSLGG